MLKKELLNEKALIKITEGESYTNISCVSQSRSSGCWFWLFEVTVEGFGGEREQGIVKNLGSFFLTLVAKWPLYAFNLCFRCLSGKLN